VRVRRSRSTQTGIISKGLAVAFLITGLSSASPLRAGQPDSALASISETERYTPTTRPSTPEAQHPPQSTPENVDTGKPVHEWQRATDDWFGLRPKLDDRGITFQANLTTDITWDLTGGAHSGDSAFLHLFSANLTIDTDRLIGWKGGTFFANFQTENGDNVAELIGNTQLVSNIDDKGFTQLAELWYEQVLCDGKLRIKAGKVDANTEFSRIEYGLEFVNSSMAYSPTILGFPTYPDPATGVNLFVYPLPSIYWGVGVYDGATQEGIATGARGPATFFGDPSDLFLISEAGLKWGKVLPGYFSAGVWRHTGTFPNFDGGTESGAAGFYLVLNQTLWRENPDKPDDTQGIGMFAMYGYADPDISLFEHQIGGGFTWTGLFPSRDNDILGLGASFVSLTDEPGAGFDRDSELVVELFYKIQILKWLSIKPDLQYIHNPGGLSDFDDAIAFTLRLQADF
jgi:porin